MALSLTVKVCGIAVATAAGQSLPPGVDTCKIYRPMALGILGGDGYALAGDARAATLIPPLTPLFLSGLYVLFGTNPPALLLPLVGALLRAATTAFVYLLGHRLLGHPAALAAALLYALDPWEVIWAAVLLKDSLAVFLFVAATLAFQRALDTPNWSLALRAGAILGLACLSRHAALGFLPVALAVCLVSNRAGMLERRGAIRIVGSLTIGVLLVLGPWLLRNRIVLGEFTSAQYVGLAFYLGNAPGAEASVSGYAGDTLPGPTLIHDVERSNGARRDGERRLFWGALEPLLRRPARVFDLLRAKLVNLLRPTFQGASLRNWVVLGVPYLLFMALALLGLGGSLDRSVRLVVPHLVVLYHLAIALVFYAEIRQRQYLVPFLALFAGLGLLRLRRPSRYSQSRPG